MPTHKSLTGSDLHFPQGKFPTPLSINSNVSNAYLIEDDNSNVQFSIDTSNSAEVVAIGNAVTNPDTVMPGTGNVGIGTDTPTSPNGNAKVVEIEGASVGLVLHSTNGGGTPYEIQNNSETLKIQYDTTNRMTVDSSGNIGFGADPSSPNGNAKVVEVKDTSVGLVLNSTNGSGVPWEIQHNSGALKIIYDGANTLGGGAKTAIALDAAGAMRLGSEVATPSVPASGDGGQVYVKSDGILYYQSDTVAETDITASGSGIAAVVDDTSPELGGNLDCNGNNILFDADTGFKDDSSGPQLTFGKTTSAVNSFTMTNAATGGNATAATITAPVLRSIGSDSNVDLGLETTGTGTVTVVGRNSNGASGVLSINNEADTFAVNITVPLADDLGADYTLTLPLDDGDSGQVMQSNGSGVLTWVTPSSGGGLTVEAQNSTTGLSGTDKFVKADSSGGAITLTLPAAATAGSGAIFVIKDIGNASTNAITIDGNSSEKIDGQITQTINSDYQSIEMLCDGTEWWIR